MTGPFVRVQEARLYGPTWVNVAQIVKIQQTSRATTISLAGAGTMQIEESAEALIGRISRALVEVSLVPKLDGRPTNGVRRGKASPEEKQHG
jgi:hypothetical protein